MPELPEVETTRCGIAPHVTGRRVVAIDVRQRQLRWPVAAEIDTLPGQRILAVERRAKYLLLRVESGTVLVHLGMSGSLRLAEPALSLRKHDHIRLILDNGRELRYHDPRRFGCWLWAQGDISSHPLLARLGPEPLERGFSAPALAAACAGRKAPIKNVIMEAQVVVGVGNIYANEALHLARLHPAAPAGDVPAEALRALVRSIRQVLRRSIRQGGTTLRDFLREDGQPGYFRQQLLVYERAGQPCRGCGAAIERVVIGQRATYYCPQCQPWPTGT